MDGRREERRLKEWMEEGWKRVEAGKGEEKRRKSK